MAIILAVSVGLTNSSAGHASTSPPAPKSLVGQALGGRCVPDAAKDVLSAYGAQVATAATVEDARALVLRQTGLARTALSSAEWMLPFSRSVRDARTKLQDLERRIYAANTQAEVANEFSALLTPDVSGNAAGIVVADVDLNKQAVKVNAGSGGCDYTTAEVIIVILGFLLFIIPGIIFLIIFC